MRKIFIKTIFLLEILIYTTFALPNAFAEDDIYPAVVGTQVVAPGEEFTISINCMGADIAGCQTQIYINDRFFDIISITDMTNDIWTIQHSNTNPISIIAYTSDMSSADDIPLLELNLRAKDYILKGDMTSISIQISKVISRISDDTLICSDSEHYIYVGELMDMRSWKSQKSTIKCMESTIADIYIYSNEPLPKWVLNACVKNSVTLNVHMIGFNYVIDFAKIDAENIKDDEYNIIPDIDYSAHKYTDNQIGVLSLTDYDYPGTLDYTIYMENSNPEDEILLYSLDEETRAYELAGQYTVDENNNIMLSVSTAGKYIIAGAEITGELLLPYKAEDIPEDTPADDNTKGTEIAAVIIVLVVIAIFWIAAVLFVRAIRRKIYRKKIEQRTMELLLQDEDEDCDIYDDGDLDDDY